MAVTDFPLIGGIGKVVLGGPERTGVVSDLLTSFWVQALHEMIKSSRNASAGNESKRKPETNMYAFFQKYAADSIQLDPGLYRSTCEERTLTRLPWNHRVAVGCRIAR